jgi:hypothetical protein
MYWYLNLAKFSLPGLCNSCCTLQLSWMKNMEPPAPRVVQKKIETVWTNTLQAAVSDSEICRCAWPGSRRGNPWPMPYPYAPYNFCHVLLLASLSTLRHKPNLNFMDLWIRKLMLFCSKEKRLMSDQPWQRVKGNAIQARFQEISRFSLKQFTLL